MSRLTWTVVAVVFCASASVTLVCCDSHGGSIVGSSGGTTTTIFEVEPANDDFMTATPLPANTAGAGGLLASGDVDHWSFAGTAGTVVQIELFATRLDHATWDAADNLPRLELIGSDGVTTFLAHDPYVEWSWGSHDLDIPCYRLPVSGTFILRVTNAKIATPGGMYAVVWKTLDHGVITNEVEAIATTGINDTTATAQAIAPGTISGWHVDDESDFYSFTAPAGSIASCELISYRNGIADGTNYYDTEIELIDSDGTTVLKNNDDSFFYDSSFIYYLGTAGTYFINVTECCGAGDGPYLLRFALETPTPHVETEPNDLFSTARAISVGQFVSGAAEAPGSDDWYSFSGVAGDLVRVQRFSGGNNYRGQSSGTTFDLVGPDGTTSVVSGSDSTRNTMQAILTSTGTHYVHVTNGAAAEYAFRVTIESISTWETEPNDVAGAANPLGAGGASSGVIGTGGDADVFGFTATAGEFVRFGAFGLGGVESDGFFPWSDCGSTLSPTLRIRDAAGFVLATSPYSGTNVGTEGVVDGLPCVGIAFAAPVAGAYYVDVQAVNAGQFGPNRLFLVKRR